MPLAFIKFLTHDGQDDEIDNSLPGSPNYPSQGLPGRPPHAGHVLPPPGSIATLPVFPFDPTRPDAGLPADQPGIDNSLPAIRPGKKYVVKWLACTGLILVPDNELPETAEPK